MVEKYHTLKGNTLCDSTAGLAGFGRETRTIQDTVFSSATTGSSTGSRGR